MEQATVRKNRFFFWAVVIAVLNPILSGLLLGLFMATEPDLKKEGRVVLAFSAVWGVIVLLLISRFSGQLGI